MILDAVSGDGAPGTTYRFEDDAIMAHFQEKVSSHEIGIQDVLAWLTVTDRAIPNVVVLGMQPYDLSAGLTLSTAMEAALPAFAQRAAEELRAWGVRLVPRTTANA